VPAAPGVNGEGVRRAARAMTSAATGRVACKPYACRSSITAAIRHPRRTRAVAAEPAAAPPASDAAPPTGRAIANSVGEEGIVANIFRPNDRGYCLVSYP
jgi:hypothetical protein